MKTAHQHIVDMPDDVKHAVRRINEAIIMDFDFMIKEMDLKEFADRFNQEYENWIGDNVIRIMDDLSSRKVSDMQSVYRDVWLYM